MNRTKLNEAVKRCMKRTVYKHNMEQMQDIEAELKKAYNAGKKATRDYYNNKYFKQLCN